MRDLRSATFALTLVAGLQATTSSVSAAPKTGNNNILVIVADDLGREVLSFYNSPTAHKAVTPNLDRLAEQGVIFDNVWGSPLSAPVRAAMLTGRYGHHTGVTDLTTPLSPNEQTLFDALPTGYANAAFGKWHLSQEMDFASDYGISHFAGLATGGGVRNYNNWRLTVDGRTQLTTEYVTSKSTDLAIEWIDKQRSPWFCWVAYNSPHTPYHLPPSGTHTRTQLTGQAEDIERNSLEYFLAMVENLDYEVGRLLASVDDNTTIIFVGDNGTENGVLQSPYPSRHGKGSLYETGVGIPMIVAGAGVTTPTKRSEAMVSAVDIFPTVMEMAGQRVPKSRYEDGYSFVSVLSGGNGERRYNFSELMHMRSGYINALSDGRYKILSTNYKIEMMFDLKSDPQETNNLLRGTLTAAQRKAFEALEAELKRLDIPKLEIKSNTQQQPNGNRANTNRANNNNSTRTRR